MARAVFPRMAAQGGGRIINVAGAAARNPNAKYVVGGAANAALVNFTMGPADLGARSSILVTAASPAATRTERWDRLMEQQAAPSARSVEVVRAEAQRAYALGRIAQPEDVADLVCVPASARASFLTGICITVVGRATQGWIRDGTLQGVGPRPAEHLDMRYPLSLILGTFPDQVPGHG